MLRSLRMGEGSLGSPSATYLERIRGRTYRATLEMRTASRERAQGNRALGRMKDMGAEVHSGK